MKTLSLRQPWLWAITTTDIPSPKRIENRVMTTKGGDRPPTWHRYRGPILLHAAKGCTVEEYDAAMTWMFDQFGNNFVYHVPTLDEMPRGGIVGRARIVDVIDKDWGQVPLLSLPDVDLRWKMQGQFGFVLTDVEPLPFTPCKGMLGLWEFDERLLEAGP